MTSEQAAEILAEIAIAFPKEEPPTETYADLIKHLEPMPYAQTADRVRVALGEWKWYPKRSELLLAAGLDSREAVRDLELAVRDGGLMLPDLRKPSGWSHVRPGTDRPPQGVAEALAVARGGDLALRLPPPPLRALPPPEERPDEPRGIARLAPLAKQLSQLARDKNARYPAGTRRVRTTAGRQTQLQEMTAELEKMDVPPPVRMVVRRLQELTREALSASAAHERAALIYAEELDEVERRWREDHPLPDVARRAAVAALAALCREAERAAKASHTPEHGWRAQGEHECVEALREALWPGLALAVLRVDPPGDEWEARPPVEQVRLLFRAAAHPRAPKVRRSSDGGNPQ